MWARLTEDDDSAGPLPERWREPLAAALDATARLVRAWGERRDEQDAADAAQAAVERLAATVGEQSGAGTDERLVTIVFDLRRVVRLVRSRLQSVRAARRVRSRRTRTTPRRRRRRDPS